jgi:hypothetical protein
MCCGRIIWWSVFVDSAFTVKAAFGCSPSAMLAVAREKLATAACISTACISTCDGTVNLLVGGTEGGTIGGGSSSSSWFLGALSSLLYF